MTMTMWGLFCREACRTHADLIRVSLIHDEMSLWPTVNITGNRNSTERERETNSSKRNSALHRALNGHKYKYKQFEITDDWLKAATGRIMKWTLQSGDKSVFRGVLSESIFSLKSDV